MIKSVIKTLRIALYETKVVLFSVKFVMLSAVSWIFMDLFTISIKQFALDYDLKMVPASLAFYFSDDVYCCISFLLLIFLFSDFPLKGSSQLQILQRSGMSCFAGGQMLASAFVTAAYTAEQLLFSVIACLPCIEFSGWGKVWGTAAAGSFLNLGYGTFSYISRDVILIYTPLQAVSASAFLFIMTGICYGILEYCLNGASKGKAGTAVLSVWSLIWIFLSTVGGDFVRRLRIFSPNVWNDIENKDIREVFETGIFLFFIAAVLFTVGRLLAKKRKIAVL